MGFDVFGPTRHVRASNIDDGGDSPYDVFELARAYGLICPQLERLGQRFYDSTLVRFAGGGVHALCDELTRLRDAYRAKREHELVEERHVRARDPAIRRSILEQVLQADVIYRVLEEFRLLCEEAIMAEADVRCEGD